MEMIKDFAIRMLQNNPNISNNPINQELVNVIKNNDSQRGEEIANNLCNTYGISKEEAIRRAKLFFNI